MNPEFQRNLYLEFSFARLIGMPLFLLFIFALSYLINEHKFDEETAAVAIWLYVFIVLFWGARQAAESIFDELRNHTWDIQKTSAISPWSLTWGKLFGSTLFNWYGGFFCLLVYAATATETDLPQSSAPVFITICYAIGSGLLVHSLSLLAGLFALRKKQTFNSSFSYLFVLFVVIYMSGMMISAKNDSLNTLNWYSFVIDSQAFGLISLFLACGWSIVGIYRLLAQELQIRTLPWIWLLFCGFLIVYSHGLIIGSDHKGHEFHQNFASSTFLMFATFAIGSCLTYGLILIDENNPMLIRRLWLYARQENWLRFFEEIPCWFVSLLLVLPASLYLSISFPFAETSEKLHFYPISAFLLMVRDVALVLFFNYAPNPKRALGLSVLYLTFLYWIIPAIFIEAGADLLAALFLPLFSENIGLSIILAGGQVALIGYLLFNRWQKTINQLQNDI